MSGGPDSLALLLLARELMGDLCEVATVDHGLRPESAAEAAMVAGLCGRLGLRHHTLAVEVAGGNLQANARSARYEALGDWCRRRGLPSLATAHHIDDQAETVLMRLNRGSGLAGLAGIRQCTRVGGLSVVRPLLAWRKAELAEIVRDCGIEPVSDPSNADERFDRSRIRAALAGADWLDPEGIAASAAHIGDAERLVRLIVSEEIERCVERPGGGLAYLPRRNGRGDGYELVHARVLAEIFRSELGVEPRFSEIRRLVNRLNVGNAGSLGGFHIVSDGDGSDRRWTINPEMPRRSR